MTTSAHRRKLLSIALGVGLLILFSGLAAMNAWNLKFLNPATTSQIVVYTGLSAVAFLLFVAVLVLLVRNVLKLYADQRSRVMGSRLRTRMLWGAVLVSLLPIAFMFCFSYLLMNRAVERWFSQPVTQIHDDSNRLATDLSRYTSANARVEAESIKNGIADLGRASLGRDTGHTKDTAASRAAVDRVLRLHELTLQGGFAMVFREGNAIAAFHMPRRDGVTAEVKPWLPEAGETVDGGDDDSKPAHVAGTALGTSMDAAILSASERDDQPMFSLGGTDYALGTAVLKQGGTVVVGLPMPYGMSNTMAQMRKAADQYWVLFRARRQVRNLYMLLLLMMTSLALFCSCWLALHLSRQVTKPVEALADAMESIAAGDYGHRVHESATEELGELVRSFNQMAADLEDSRAQVDASTALLSDANAALRARRGELETMLETIPNGVATLDRERRIVLANRALSEMIDPGGQRPFIGRTLSEVFPAEVVEPLDRLVLRSHRMGSASGEMEMDTGSGVLNLLATVALLETGTGRSLLSDPQEAHLGYVLVLENATELLRAQRQSAWKEVARRVAHEIKNPLTPISLNAEQIGRHIERIGLTLEANSLGSPSVAIIRRSSEVISSSVESMRSLVDQFAALAEFPTARPRPADLNTIVENSLAMFAGRMQGIRLVRRFAEDLPLVMADPEAMKRALGNLIDNAVEAMQQSLLREMWVSTALLANGMVELTVADTGAGLTAEMRERLFLPYFSTKQRGTGLGLAIAAKIIQEHQGTIRAEKNEPAGARFIVELKPASGEELGETSAVHSTPLNVGAATTARPN
ncbi:HAMP domain-containing protein [Granulicella sp. WH15]|uniref:sensor histidine kinase n=1 Tax=Granulicella sp. WH15 TaxID=2602070 RepID=UPI001366A70C|nr:ATP-binding protein [Granulicella sp. WH15]QHN04825.1 HAMP domain-containing protein [Granulicella sp. WH15]